MLIGIIFLILTIIVIIATPLILKYQKQRLLKGKYSSKTDAQEQQQESTEKPSKNNIKDLWEIKDIRNGVVITDDGRHRIVVRIGSIDYHLMSVNEQTAIESVLLSLGISLNFPIQFFTTTELVDTKNCITTMYNRLNEPLNDKMRAYILNSIEYMNSMMQNRGVHTRTSYAVISYNNAPYEKASAELYRRAELVIGQFGRCNIKCEILNSDGVVDLLFRVFNRSRTVKPSELVASGGMDLYKKGVGVNGIMETAKGQEERESKESQPGDEYTKTSGHFLS